MVGIRPGTEQGIVGGLTPLLSFLHAARAQQPLRYVVEASLSQRATQGLRTQA